MKLSILGLVLFSAAISPRPGMAYVTFYNDGYGDMLARGDQPSEATLRLLKGKGVKAIVNLRQGNIAKEAAMVKRAGLKYQSYPVPDRGTPSFSQVVGFLNYSTDPQNQPVFVHCAHGVGRTGIFVAAYRIAVDGLSVDAALAEARKFGMTSKSQHGWVKKYAAELQAMQKGYASRKQGTRLAQVRKPGEKLLQIYYRSIPGESGDAFDKAKKEFEDQANAGCESRAKKAADELLATTGGKAQLSGGSCEFSVAGGGQEPKKTLFCRCVATIEKKEQPARNLAGGAI
jgi:protein tyrosine phosphatase (PTP) superfamily phosphohydrolase (DUF442 family)